ncbi:MAG TPA: DUF3137 domain-containing protein [Micavibrio sp.]|jgi:hypothetical protein
MTNTIQILLDETESVRAELEARREVYLRVFLMGAPMSFAAICAIAAINTQEGIFPWAAVGIMTLAAVVIGFQILNGLYRTQTKSAFLNKIAAALGLSYHRLGVFSLGEIQAHKILPFHDVQKIEDGFSGSINGVDVAFEEVALADRVRSENQEREEISFWGLVIRIRIGKVLDAHTVVLPRSATQTFFRTMFSSFERVKLVSPKFEEAYDVMSTSQVEARYILDPAFMERFIEAGKLLGSRGTQASFRDREIAFAVQRNRPMFEIGWLFRPLTGKSLEGVVDELKAVIALIDALRLNPYHGLGASLPPRRE